MKKIFTLKKKGFTLIELLVVITIISILVGVGTFSYQNAQKKARDNKRKRDLATISTTVELFRDQTGALPCCVVKSTESGWITTAQSGGLFDSLVNGEYIKELPTDPINTQNLVDGSNNFQYLYINVINPNTGENIYVVLANLENNNDPDINFSGSSIPTINAYAGFYNYILPNP